MTRRQAGMEKRHSNRTEKLPISPASMSPCGKSVQVVTIKERMDRPSRTKEWLYLCGSGRHAMLGIEQLSPFQEHASNAEHPVGDAAQGTTVGRATCAQRLLFRSFCTATRVQWNTASRSRAWAA
jgi:hypothetical protein